MCIDGLEIPRWPRAYVEFTLLWPVLDEIDLDDLTPGAQSGTRPRCQGVILDPDA
jgi:hypothetical protein